MTESLKIKNKILTDSLWLLIGSGSLRGGIFLLTILFARLLEVDEFGHYNLIKATAIFAVGIVSYFFSIPITKKIAESIKNDNGTILNSYLGTIKVIEFTIYLVISILLFIIYKFNLGTFFLTIDLSLTDSIFIFIIFVLNSRIALNQGILLGFQKSITIGKLNFFAFIISLPIILIILYTLKSLLAALICISIIYLFQVLFMNYEKKKILKENNISASFLFDKKSFLSNMRFSIPLLLMSLSSNAGFYISKLILVNKSNLSELAIFEASYSWLVIIMFVLSTITLPVIGNIAGLNNKQKEKEYLKTSTFLVFLIACLFCVCIYLFQEQLFLLYASKYDLHQTLLVLAVASIPLSFFYLFDKVLIAKGRQWACLLVYVFQGISIITLSYIKADNALELSYCFLLSTSISSLLMISMHFFMNRKHE